MKNVTKMGAQGDVVFRKVKAIPKEAQPVAMDEKRGGHVVAHSETGHDHVIHDPGMQLFAVPGDEMRMWAKFDKSTRHVDVVHHRPWDTHETLRLLADGGGGETIYEIRRQREHTPEGWRRIED